MFSKKLITSIGGLLITASAVLAFPETPRRIEISAKKFSYSPNEITLKKDKPVVLVFHSEDGTHGFKLSEMNIKSDEIKKGKDSEVSFTPTQVGHFVGKCAHFCGKGHGSMTLQIDVVEWGPLPKNPEREFEVGDKIRVNLDHGRIENAVVHAVTQDADGIKLKVDVVGLDLTALMTSGVKVTFHISKSQFFFASLRNGLRRKASPQALVPLQAYFCLFQGQLFRAGQCFFDRRL